jgi:hypothetical protein
VGLFSRRRVPPPTVAPAPAGPYAVMVQPQWAPFNPQAPSNAQVGRYSQPYGVPTQAAAYWPDIQLKCGVEGMRPWWYVPTSGDVPYFQQTTRPVDPRKNLLDGGRPGPQLGPAQVAQLLGPQRQVAARQLQAVANGLMGW